MDQKGLIFTMADGQEQRMLRPGIFQNVSQNKNESSQEFSFLVGNIVYASFPIDMEQTTSFPPPAVW